MPINMSAYKVVHKNMVYRTVAIVRMIFPENFIENDMNEDFRDYVFERDVEPYLDYDYYINDVIDKLNYKFLRLDGTNVYEEEV